MLSGGCSMESWVEWCSIIPVAVLMICFDVIFIAICQVYDVFACCICEKFFDQHMLTSLKIRVPIRMTAKKCSDFVWKVSAVSGANTLRIPSSRDLRDVLFHCHDRPSQSWQLEFEKSIYKRMLHAHVFRFELLSTRNFVPRKKQKNQNIFQLHWVFFFSWRFCFGGLGFFFSRGSCRACPFRDLAAKVLKLQRVVP